MPRISLLITEQSAICCLTMGIWIAPAAALIALAIAHPLWSWIRLESSISYLGQEFMLLDQEPHMLSEINTECAPQQVEDLLEQRINAMRVVARRVRDLSQFISDSLNSLPDATLITTIDGHVLVSNQFSRDYFAAAGIRNIDGALLPYLVFQHEYAAGNQHLRQPQVQLVGPDRP